MKRETIYYCEGPDCNHHIRTAEREPPARGWLLVIERAGYDADPYDYCSWECVMRAAARLDPPEIIDLRPDSLGPA